MFSKFQSRVNRNAICFKTTHIRAHVYILLENLINIPEAIYFLYRLIIKFNHLKLLLPKH